MEKKEKQFYEAPSTTVFEVRHEGIICASDVETSGDPLYNGFNTEEVW